MLTREVFNKTIPTLLAIKLYIIFKSTGRHFLKTDSMPASQEIRWPLWNTEVH